MNSRFVVFFSGILFILFLSGCLWPFSKGGRRAALPVPAEGVSVEMIDPGALKKGGKIYFFPLSAGTDAEAGEDLDRIALMMVKGFSDALEQGGGLVAVSGDDAAHADIVIKGHIEQLKRQGRLHRTLSVKVRADVRMASTGAVVALVYAECKVPDIRKAADQAAYDIGYAVAGKL